MIMLCGISKMNERIWGFNISDYVWIILATAFRVDGLAISDY